VFNCPELTDYLATPHRLRTKSQRSIAYIESYDMLINWWQNCLDRNRETPILKGENREINIPHYLAELEEKRNSFLLDESEYDDLVHSKR
jgi:hypothetical protein